MTHFNETVNEIVNEILNMMDTRTVRVADIIPAVLHKWDDDTVTVICYGATNSGKTLLLSRLYDDTLAASLKLEIPGATEAIKLLEDEDCPDKSEYIVRVAFEKDVTFYDSPGFLSDDPKLANMSRAFAKLEQQGPPAYHVSEIRVVDTAIAPLAVQEIPIAEIENRLPMENPIALYCMDPTLTPFSPAFQEATRADILALHENYGKHRLIVVCPFEDKFDLWDPKRREQRKEILDYALATDILGRDAIIGCSSTTGQGLQTVVKRIFSVCQQNTAKLAQYIDEAALGSRFQHVLLNLSKLLAGGLIKDGILHERTPYSDLFKQLVAICSVYLQVSYSVDEATWRKCKGKIEAIMMSHEIEQLDKNVVARQAKGWWERFLGVFGKQYRVIEYSVSLALVKAICAALYEIIHPLEKSIKTERVDAERVETWFAEAFAERPLQDAIRRRDVVEAQLILEATLTAFFAKFHDESLDQLTLMAIEKEEANHAA